MKASPENKASRLFIETLAREEFRIRSNPSYLQDLDRFQMVAAQFYAQYWDDRIGTGVHPAIDGLRGYHQVEITWKGAAKALPSMTLEDLLRRRMRG